MMNDDSYNVYNEQGLAIVDFDNLLSIVEE